MTKILRFNSDDFVLVAALLSDLIFKVDPTIDEEDVFDEIVAILDQDQGRFSIETVHDIATLANATRFNPQKNMWN